MEQIKDILPKALETLARPTKAEEVSIEGWEKWFPQFKTLNDPQLERMKQEAMRFGRAKAKELTPRWLSLLGTSGAGKTMLAQQICKRIPGSRFIKWLLAVEFLRDGEYRWFSDLCAEPVLCLDDIGAEYQTDFVRGKLYEILSRREKRWTILTANLSLEGVNDKLESRIASRMIRNNSVVVDVDVPDFNLRSICPQIELASTDAALPQQETLAQLLT